MNNLTSQSVEWQAVMADWLSSNPDLDASVIFSDDEYGLLNAAKFALQVFENVNTTSCCDSPDNSSLFADNDGPIPAHVVSKSPSIYSIWEIIILSVIITAMMIVIVVGNMLVVIAIATENNLTTVQNWFIASLAVADMLIGLVVMPFSLSFELMGYWMFGDIWCEIHGALDVFLCTSSIMNICLISLDRYWSITKAISYLNQRTPNRVAVMIVMVWVLSGFISIPPLLGWKKDVDLTWFWELLASKGNQSQMDFLQDLEESGRIDLHNFTQTLETVVYPTCGLSQDLGYVMYSAFGSFYIPSCIMVFVYIKIYYAARERARRVINKPGVAKRISRRFTKSSSTNAAAAVEAANRRTSNVATISNNPNGGCHISPNNTTVNPSTSGAAGGAAAIEVEAESNKKAGQKRARFQESEETAAESEAFLPAKNGTKQKKRLVHILSATCVEPPLTSNGGLEGRPSDPCEEVLTSRERSHAYGACASGNLQLPQEPRKRRSIGVCTKDESQDNEIRKDNISTASTSSNSTSNCLKLKLRSKFRNQPPSRPSRKETCEVIDTGKRKRSSPLNGILKKMESKPNMPNIATDGPSMISLRNNNPSSGGGTQQNVPPVAKLTPEQEAEKEKKRIARKKERRATLILGLIMGSFIACWFPFFFLYSISPVCPICELSPESACCVRGWGFTFAFWLGYSNSALNPVIYTVFNKDFRRAFKRILFK